MVVGGSVSWGMSVRPQLGLWMILGLFGCSGATLAVRDAVLVGGACVSGAAGHHGHVGGMVIDV